jgi:hypothetical protein
VFNDPQGMTSMASGDRTLQSPYQPSMGAEGLSALHRSYNLDQGVRQEDGSNEMFGHLNNGQLGPQEDEPRGPVEDKLHKPRRMRHLDHMRTKAEGTSIWPCSWIQRQHGVRSKDSQVAWITYRPLTWRTYEFCFLQNLMAGRCMVLKHLTRFRACKGTREQQDDARRTVWARNEWQLVNRVGIQFVEPRFKDSCRHHVWNRHARTAEMVLHAKITPSISTFTVHEIILTVCPYICSVYTFVGWWMVSN